MDGSEVLQARFRKLFKMLGKTKREFADNSAKLNAQITEEIGKHKTMQKTVEDEIRAFNTNRRKVAETALFVQNNRIIDLKEVERHEQAEAGPRAEILRLRYKNIFLRNKLAEKEAEIKTGIDYEEMEQSMMQNQTLQDRVDQKTVTNERVKGNLMRRVACITHVRQKTDMMLDELSGMNTQCKSLDLAIQRLKEDLTHLRKTKDYFRKKLEIQRRDNGILGQDSLLRDMEDQFDGEERQSRMLQTLVDRTNAFNAETARLHGVIRTLEAQGKA